MGKKEKSISILKEVDTSLDKTYADLQKEIEDMQIRLAIADKKAKKKAKRYIKHNKGIPKSEYNNLKLSIRKDIINEMENSSFMDRVEATIKDLVPIVVIICRLVASLICAILSLDAVKSVISPVTLNRMDSLYHKVMAVGC